MNQLNIGNCDLIISERERTVCVANDYEEIPYCITELDSWAEVHALIRELREAAYSAFGPDCDAM